VKLNGWLVGAVAFMVAAGCSKAPKPMTDAERTALADSVSQVATQWIASFETQATTENWFSHYVRGNDLVHAQDGMIYPTYDSLVNVVRASLRPGSSWKMTLDQKRLSVLDRDVVVVTALLNGVLKDSAGTETPWHRAWTTVWHRTPDGWKIAVDNASAAPPAPPPAKPARR